MNGSIIQTQTIEIKKRLDESDEELLTIAITEFRTKFNSTSKEIIVPFDIILVDENLKFTVPKLGEKKKLLELSQKNVLFFKKEKLNQYEKLNPDLRTDRILTQMQKDLGLPNCPSISNVLTIPIFRALIRFLQLWFLKMLSLQKKITGISM